MIINLTISFLFGFGVALAICLRRHAEQKRAFDAACGRIESLREELALAYERERGYQDLIARVRARARDLRRKFDLSEKAEPPALAEPSSKRQGSTRLTVSSFMREFSGSSHGRRSRFFRRYQ